MGSGPLSAQVPAAKASSFQEVCACLSYSIFKGSVVMARIRHGISSVPNPQEMGALGSESRRVILSLCVCRGEGSSGLGTFLKYLPSLESWHLHQAPQIDQCGMDEAVSLGKWHAQRQTGPPKTLKIISLSLSPGELGWRQGLIRHLGFRHK